MNSFLNSIRATFFSTGHATLFDKLGKKAIWFSIGIISVMVYAIYKDYILFQDAFIFSYDDPAGDDATFFYPYTYLQVEYFQKHGYLSWSFQYGAGQSCTLFSLMEVFNPIFYLVKPQKIHYLFIVRELIKIFLIAILSYKFFRLIDLSHTASFIGCLLLTFCSYVIVGGTWYGFSYDTFCLILFLFAIESALMRSRFIYLPIAIFCIAISQPMNLWVFGLFMASYLSFRFVFLDRNSFKVNFNFLLKAGLYSATGLLLSCPFLFENIVQMLDSPRATMNFLDPLKSTPIFQLYDPFQLSVCFLRFLSSSTIGDALHYGGASTYMNAQVLYCGLPSLLLAPQIIAFTKDKKRLACLAFFLVWFIPLFFPYFRYALWCFKGDYFRAYGLILSTILIITSVTSIDYIIKRGKINMVLLISTLIILLILIPITGHYLNTVLEKKVTDVKMVFLIAGLLFLYALFLVLFHKTRFKKLFLYLFMIVLIGELYYNSDIDVNNRVPESMSSFNSRKQWDGKIGFADYVKEIAAYLKEREKTFFRINKDFNAMCEVTGGNEAMLNDYYSSTSYTSFNQVNFINYLLESGVADNNEWETRWGRGFKYNRVLEALNCTRYTLTNDYGWPPGKLSFLDSIAKIGTIYILKNRFALPFGYAYTKLIQRDDFLKGTPKQREFLLMNSCYVDSTANQTAKQLLAPFSLKDTIAGWQLTNESFKSCLDKLRKDTLTFTSFEETKITGTVNSTSDEVLYISMPYDKGWHLKVDDKEDKFIKVNGGMSGILLTKGPHKIEMEFKSRYFYKGLLCAIVGAIALLILFYFNHRKQTMPSSSN